MDDRLEPAQRLEALGSGCRRRGAVGDRDKQVASHGVAGLVQETGNSVNIAEAQSFIGSAGDIDLLIRPVGQRGTADVSPEVQLDYVELRVDYVAE